MDYRLLLLFKASDERNAYSYDFCPFGALQGDRCQDRGARPKRLRWHEGWSGPSGS
jgi:hypothetical protein